MIVLLTKQSAANGKPPGSKLVIAYKAFPAFAREKLDGTAWHKPRSSIK